MDLDELNARIVALMEDTLRTVDRDDPADAATAAICSQMLREARQRRRHAVLRPLPQPLQVVRVARPRERASRVTRRRAAARDDPDEPDPPLEVRSLARFRRDVRRALGGSA